MWTVDLCLASYLFMSTLAMLLRVSLITGLLITGLLITGLDWTGLDWNPKICFTHCGIQFAMKINSMF